EEAQRRHGGFLPQAEFPALAADLGVPVYRLFGVASFFPHFRLTPPPVLDVRVCTDMSCHVRGAAALLDACTRAAATRPNGQVTVAPVSCLGRCDGAPACTVNDVPYWGLPAGGGALVAAVESGAPLPAPPAPPVLRNLASDPYAGGEQPY